MKALRQFGLRKGMGNIFSLFENDENYINVRPMNELEDVDVREGWDEVDGEECVVTMPGLDDY
jgi:hypothetical protein